MSLTRSDLNIEKEALLDFLSKPATPLQIQNKIPHEDFATLNLAWNKMIRSTLTPNDPRIKYLTQLDYYVITRQNMTREEFYLTFKAKVFILYPKRKPNNYLTPFEDYEHLQDICRANFRDPAKKDLNQRTVKTLAILGGLMMGVGIILFFFGPGIGQLLMIGGGVSLSIAGIEYGKRLYDYLKNIYMRHKVNQAISEKPYAIAEDLPPPSLQYEPPQIVERAQINKVEEDKTKYHFFQSTPKVAEKSKKTLGLRAKL